MKTKNLLTRISAAALIAAAAVLPAALTSCSSDSEPAPTPDPIPEGMARINLSLGVPEMSTRAESNLTEDEKKVDDLWVYFYRKGTDGNYTIWNSFEIIANGTDSETGAQFSMLADNKIQHQTTTDGYQTIISNMNIPAGTYHVYVLGNIADYDQTGENSLKPTGKTFSMSETNFRNAILSTGQSINLTGASAKQLPMAADRTNLEATNATINTTSGDLEITSGNVTIKATMTILCAKVRYTVLFDNSVTGSGESTVFGHSYPYKTCDFAQSTAKLNNYNQATPLYSRTLQDSEYNKVTTAVAMNWGRVEYPTNDWISSETPGNALSVDNSTSTDGKIAYQQTLYLTENVSSAKTTVELTIKLDGADKAFTLYLPKKDGTGADATLTRGNFYDVIGKITTEGMGMEVKIKPWATTTLIKKPL